MFLFTTPTTTGQAAPASPVIDAVRRGAEQTGTDFGYLLNTARRESALDPAAKAPTSSASGLFQFIEQTWLGLMKTEGPKLGLGDAAASISSRSEGGYAVADSGTRQAILKLREDPYVSSVMAGALTQQNREALATATGRDPSAAELYMAHLLGPRGAADLIRTAIETPDRAVALDMPEAAAANRSIFYDRQGRGRGAGELYAILSAAPAGTSAAPARRAATVETPPPRPTGPALHSLFQTGGRTGPISDAVARLWRVNNAQVDPKQSALAFFPRLETVAAEETGPEPDASPPSPPPVQNAGPALVPLPPPRPRNLVPSTGARRA